MKKIISILLVLALFSPGLIAQTRTSCVVNFKNLQQLNSFNLLPDTTMFSNLLPCDSSVFSYGLDKKNPIDSGWMEGNNYKLTKAIAEYYPFGDGGICADLVSIAVQLAHVHFATTNDAVTFYVWKADGVNGSPGTVLASKNAKLNTLDTTKMDFIYFTSSIKSPGNIYIGFSSANYKNNKFSFKPSISCYQSGIGQDDNCGRDSAQGTAWIEDKNGNWSNYRSFWGAYASNTLYARVISEPSCGPITISPNAPSICKGKSVTLTASGNNITSFAWTPATGLNVTTGATVKASPSVTTTYSCSGNGSTGGCCMATVTVTVLNTPTVSITQSPCSAHVVLLTATASSGSDPIKYQWKLGNTNISGATKSTYSATATGTYKCQVTDKTTNCKITSNQLSVTINCRLTDEISEFALNVYPNPTSEDFNVMISSNNDQPATIDVLVLSGKTIQSFKDVPVNSPFRIQNLNAGVYMLKVVEDENCKIIKAIVSK